jgi:hypothetical protein
MYLLSNALAVAIVAYVYSQVLTEPGMIFNRLYNALDRTLPEWLFRPLIGCMYCVAGQMALWYYLSLSVALSHIPYDLFGHIFFICLSVFLISFIHKAYLWSKQL